MNATQSRVIRIGYQWSMTERATGREVTFGIGHLAASSDRQTHDGLVKAAARAIRAWKVLDQETGITSTMRQSKYRTQIVRHWVEV